MVMLRTPHGQGAPYLPLAILNNPFTAFGARLKPLPIAAIISTTG